jgi:hypothetical protein
MSETILTKERITFKEIEQIGFNLACEITNQILETLLESYDKQAMESRDKAKYRHKGYETTTVKTKTGLVKYTRAKYLVKQEDGTNKCVYLTDEELEIKKIGLFSGGIIDLIVKNIKEVSYRCTADNINNCTGLDISAVGAWNVVQDVAEKIKKYEQEKVQAYKEDKLVSGTKVVPVVYQEADEILIYSQGKTRKENIEKYKKAHPDEEVPKRVRNIELKLGMTYEGWKEISKGRYELVGKEYVSGSITGQEMADITNANLHSKYNMSKVELRALNSDGGSWIKRLLVTGMIYQADNFHIKDKIYRHVREPEDVTILRNMFWKKEYKEMIEYVEVLKYKYNGEYEEVKKLKELETYLLKRKDSIKRYNDNPEIKIKLKTFSKQTGLKYRNMGCQESNNYCRLTRRMKHRRMSWSKSGSENLAKVITTYESSSCEDIIEHFNIQILPESFTEYAEKHITQIEENIKKMKSQKVKMPSIYEVKQGSLVGHPNIKNILSLTPVTELTYR